MASPPCTSKKARSSRSATIEVGKRNDTDIVVLSGLKEGEMVALEDPLEAAKRAKKL